MQYVEHSNTWKVTILSSNSVVLELLHVTAFTVLAFAC